MCTKFKTTLINEHIPSKLVKGNGNLKPWITPHVKNMKNKLSRLSKKSKRTSDQADRARYIKTKASVQREERQNYWRYTNTLKRTYASCYSVPIRIKQLALTRSQQEC